MTVLLQSPLYPSRAMTGLRHATAKAIKSGGIFARLPRRSPCTMRDKPLQRAQAARYRSSLHVSLQEDSNAPRTSAAPLFHHETGPARRKVPVNRFAIADVDCATGRQSRIAFKNGKSPTMPMNKPHLEFHKIDMKEGW